MEKEISENLVFLTKNLTDLTIVLAYLEQCYIISKEEGDEIKAENTPNGRNYKLLSTLQKKNWPEIRNVFLEILHKTNNERCAQEIQGRNVDQSISQKLCRGQTKNFIFHPKINKKWWPEKKSLIKSLLRRKSRDTLLIDELHSRISRDENRMLVICESPAASKFSGMGGVGKTLTAKWYANTYEQEYDHIIWIDCGEGSLLMSFESLARDLKIEDRNELVKVQDISRKCFDSLRGFKCLWVFDNAENYKGADGIKNVLPKDEKNFYCIITSRSSEWGTETGFGKISDLELDIFSEEESLEFYKYNLNSSIKHTESQIKELCRLMGNLPLALQLAVAALNCGKISLKSYLEKNKFEKVIADEFDDYERTINKNVEIALELILKENSGKEAHEMLIIFGYIRPDDVEIEFFMKVLNYVNTERLKGAIKILKKYSLVAKKKVQTWRGTTKITLSVHRLLQQVIRYNGQETEKETLRKILGCEGFIDYKLIPFTKYADEDLIKEFPKVKAELLHQRQLRRLIKEERFEEAVHLARFIDTELKTKTSKFNLAICMTNNQQFEKSLNILKELEKKDIKETINHRLNVIMGMLVMEEDLSMDLIFGHLLIIYWKMDKKRDLKELLESRRSFEVIYFTYSLDTLIRLVHSDLIKSNYSLVKESDNHKFFDNSSSTIKLGLGGESSKIELGWCSLDLLSFNRLSPKELELKFVSFSRNGREMEEANISEFCDFHKINKLILEGGNMSIELSDEISMEYLSLDGVKVLNWKEARWNIQRLKLEHVPFVEKTKTVIKEMDFYSSSFDISCLPPTIEKLHLDTVDVVCNQAIDLPNLKYLKLYSMSDSSFLSSFRSTNLTHIHFYGMKEVNVDQMPKSVTQIKIISNISTKVVGGVRRVDKLILNDFSFKEVEELLGHFQTDELVVHSDNSFTPKDLIELRKKEIKRIVVGEKNWEEEDFSFLLTLLNRKADYYL